jgi:predicted HAD superfamily Cof-like phosphohydrolase
MSTNFEDVGKFHQKFDLANMNDGSACAGLLDHLTNEELDRLLKFRIHFMAEELHEFSVASADLDHEKMFDALLDLAYVVFGTAHLLGYPWQAGWDEVQHANMTKERCLLDHHFVQIDGLNRCAECHQPKEAHSVRGSSHDVIKPKGWIAPAIRGVLQRAGFNVKA